MNGTQNNKKGCIPTPDAIKARQDAKSWIIDNQLGRRNLTREQKKESGEDQLEEKDRQLEWLVPNTKIVTRVFKDAVREFKRRRFQGGV